MRRPVALVGCAAVLACAALPALAQDSGTRVSLYTLRKDSLFETGCFGPCACPVLEQGPVQGRFSLRFEGFD